MTLSQIRNVIDIFLRDNKTGEGEELWALLAALRGPDSENEHLKSITTARIRRKLVPLAGNSIAEHVEVASQLEADLGIELPSSFIDWRNMFLSDFPAPSLSFYLHALLSAEGRQQGHFVRHVVRAAIILNMRIYSHRPPSCVRSEDGLTVIGLQPEKKVILYEPKTA
jgi:hypothetical protein